MELQCPGCEHVWNYQGESKYYVTCPRCYKKINVAKKVIQLKKGYNPGIPGTRELMDQIKKMKKDIKKLKKEGVKES